MRIVNPFGVQFAGKSYLTEESVKDILRKRCYDGGILAQQQNDGQGYSFLVLLKIR